MDLLLQSAPSDDACTLGDLFINAAAFCFTLEDVVREIPGVPVEQWKIQDQTAIPAGRYPVTWDYSPHFGRNMLHINLVPGFSGIRIHSGSRAADTDGCILVGDHKNADSISGGLNDHVLEKLEARVVPVIKSGENVWITIQRSLPDA